MHTYGWSFIIGEEDRREEEKVLAPLLLLCWVYDELDSHEWTLFKFVLS